MSGVAPLRGTLARVGVERIVTSAKTKKSTPKVALMWSNVDPLARLADEHRSQGALALSLWTDTRFVFTTEAGRAKKLSDVGIHRLGHSVATGMMDGGEPPVPIPRPCV